MTSATHNRRPRLVLARQAAGLGMVELLISLAIMAMLLTSVAAAFRASCHAVEENQKIATVTHNARIVLNRMMAQVRQADWISRADGDPQWKSEIEIEPASFSGPELVCYELDDAGVMWYHETIGGAVNSYPILGGDEGVTVNSFLVRFEEDSYYDEGLGQTVIYVQRITADLDLAVEGNRFTVTASTNPRRSLPW